MIDPVQAFAKTTFSLFPTSTASASPTSLPTVLPPQPHYEHVHAAGKTTLWIVTVGMVLSSIIFTVMAARVPVQKRLFHVITTFITVFAAISYFAMATGDGNSFAKIVLKEEHHGDIPATYETIYRQVFWARYIDWSVTTPLLLLDLAFLAGLSGADILIAIVADVIMILTGLFAAFGREGGQKWGYYAIACFAYLVVVWQLAIPGRRAVKSKDAKTARLFASIGGFTLVLWTLYPIVWGIGDGARKWSVDNEIIAYAILDVLAKPVFGMWLLFAHGQNAATSIEGFWAHGLSSEGAVRLDDEEGA